MVVVDRRPRPQRRARLDATGHGEHGRAGARTQARSASVETAKATFVLETTRTSSPPGATRTEELPLTQVTSESYVVPMPWAETVAVVVAIIGLLAALALALAFFR